MKKIRLLFTLVVSLLFAASSMAQEIHPAHWVSDMPNDMRITQLSIPLAHDAATHASISAWWKDQDYDEKKCFERGVRAFDLRIGNAIGDVEKAGGGAFYHDTNGMNSFSYEISKHMPTAEQLFATNETLGENTDPSQRGEFMILYIGNENINIKLDKKYPSGAQGDNEKWQDEVYEERKIVSRLLKLLVKKYATDAGKRKEDVFIPYRKDLTLGEMRGKIIIFMKPSYALKNYCNFDYGNTDLGEDVWVPISTETGGKDGLHEQLLDVGSESEYIGILDKCNVLSYTGTETKEWPNTPLTNETSADEPKAVGEMLSQNYYEDNRAAKQMGTYFKWAHDNFNKKIDHLNNQNILLKSHLNGYTYVCGGMGTACDWNIIFGAKTINQGANHRAYDYIKNVDKPLGIVGFDFCGSDDTDFSLLTYLSAWAVTVPTFDPYGKKLIDEIIRHNYITRSYHEGLKEGFISDIMVCCIPKDYEGNSIANPNNHYIIGKLAEQKLAEKGYKLCWDINCDDLLKQYENASYRIFFGVKRTCDPDSAINNIILVENHKLEDYFPFHDKVSQLSDNEPFEPNATTGDEKKIWNQAFWGSYYYKPIKVLDLSGRNAYGDLRGGIADNNLHIFLWQEKNPKRDNKRALLESFTKNDNTFTTTNPTAVHFLGYGEGFNQGDVKGIKDFDATNYLNITPNVAHSTYFSTRLHQHTYTENDKSYDATSHYKYCSECHYMFDVEDHTFAYEKTEAGFLHRKYCECGYSETEECIKTDADLVQSEDYPQYFASGMGICKDCKNDAYQRAVLREDSVYEISNEGQLHWFSRKASFDNPNINAELKNNLTLYKSFLPIGILSSSAMSKYVKSTSEEAISKTDDSTTDPKIGLGYKGTFDGKGYYIEDMNLDNNLSLFAEGMFSFVDGGTIKNLGLINCNAKTGKVFVGSFAGLAKNAKFENLYSRQAQLRSTPKEDTNGNLSVSAGMVGFMSNCVLKNGYFCGDLKTTQKDGGLIQCAVGIWSPEDIVQDGVGTLKSSTVSNFYCRETNSDNVIMNYKDKELTQIHFTTADEFKSGKVCYLLNTDDGEENNRWFQRISTNETVTEGDPVDLYPVLRPEAGGSYTVYGGYKHGHTDLSFTNSSADAGHTHPYDASAESEETGNHDISYVLSENYPKWRIDENDKPFAKWNFKCEVCNDEQTLEDEASSDETKTDKAATCTENGHRYLTCTHELNDNVAITKTYDYVLDPIGHDFSTKVLAEHPDGWAEGDDADKIYEQGDGLYSYICKNDHSHRYKDVKVLKDYAPGKDLELFVKHFNGQTVWETTEAIELTDNNQFKNIHIEFYSFPTPIPTPTYTRIMKNQWGTIVMPFSIQESSTPNQYDFYKVSSVEDNTLVLTKVNTTNAGDVLLVRVNSSLVADGKTYELKLRSANYCVSIKEPTTTTVNGLTFTGSYSTKDITNEDGYIIANNKFWNIHDLAFDEEGNRKKTADGKDISVSCLPFHAYLSGNLANGAKVLNIGASDDESSAIETINALTSGEAEYYDMNGRRISDLQHGVNIVKYGNGETKKVILK